jgi:uncharacterized membrane protein
MVLLLRFIYVLPVLSAAALLYIWNKVNPSEATPGEILLVFVLLYAFCLSIFFLLARLVFRLYKRLGLDKADDSARSQFKARKVYYVASVVAFFPVLLLAMQSIGQLKLNDVILVGVLISLAVFTLLSALKFTVNLHFPQVNMLQ